jgi:hypothetical protein
MIRHTTNLFPPYDAPALPALFMVTIKIYGAHQQDRGTKKAGPLTLLL